MPERFWSKVDKGGPIPEQRPELGPCWNWTAYCDPQGYGRFGIGSRADNTRTSALAHHWSFTDAYGPIPEGKEIDHLCRNPSCVRPDHMEAVTHAENVQRGTHTASGGWQRAKTHCPEGHEYTPEITGLYPIHKNGHLYHYRACKECRRVSQRNRRL